MKSAPVKHKPSATTLSAKVLKVMSLFSGVQVVGILCSIIRAKLVSIWLGPVGVGTFGLYNTALDTITSLSQLGSGIGVIRALASSPRATLPRLVTIVRRWGWGLGLLGALLTICLSPWLSRITFGDSRHTIGFVILSVSILLLTLSNNESAVFQGLKQYKKLAKSSVGGAIIGLLLSIPMFYYWGMDSIIPSILVYTIATWVCRGLYREKVEAPSEPISAKATIVEGRQFVILGLFMTITVFATNAVSFIFLSYLNRTVGTETAGLYQAGFTLVNRYVGIILAAIGTEYLPRLSEVGNSRYRGELFLSHEIILILSVIFPVVVIFITADSLIVRLLYDREFEQMLPFVTFAIVGTVFRAWSWCTAFLILAKNDGVAFLVTELISAVVAVTLNIVFYNHLGMLGLGIAYIVWYAIYVVEILITCRWRYGVAPRKNAIIYPAAIFVICMATVISKWFLGWQACLPFAILSLAISGLTLGKLLRRKNKSF